MAHGDWMDDPPDEGFSESDAGAADPGLRGRATDFMRKALVAGAGALFLTEEGIRNLVGELKLPKEILTSLLAQADKTKQDLVRTLGEEVRRFLESAALHQELGRLINGMTLEIKAEVKLHPAKAPEVVGSPQVSLKRGAKTPRGKGGA